MHYLNNIKMNIGPRPIEFTTQMPKLYVELAHQAYLLCRVDRHDPDIDDLNELIGLMLRELTRAGESGAEWFRKSIRDESVADNEYTRSFCTSEGYIDREGPVNVLLNSSFKVDGARIDWSTSPAYVRDLHSRHWPSLMMGAFALHKLNSLVERGSTVGSGWLSTDGLDQVVDALCGGNFNQGWAQCEEYGEGDVGSSEEKREGAVSSAASQMARLRHAENYALAATAIKYWEDNIDPKLSAQKAATELVKIVPLSHKRLAEIVSAAKKERSIS